MGTAAVAGLTALLTVSSVAFGLLKLAGAAYLCVLGVQALRSAWRGDPLTGDADGAPSAAGDGRVPARLAERPGERQGGPVLDGARAAVHGRRRTALGAAMAVSMPLLGFAWLAAYAALAGRLRTALSGRRWLAASTAGPARVSSRWLRSSRRRASVVRVVVWSGLPEMSAVRGGLPLGRGASANRFPRTGRGFP